MATYLNYDNQGFIVGTRRLEDNIKLVHDDTQEIIRILTSQNQINNTVMSRIVRSTERLENKIARRLNGQAQNYDPRQQDRQRSESRQDNTAGRQSNARDNNGNNSESRRNRRTGRITSNADVGGNVERNNGGNNQGNNNRPGNRANRRAGNNGPEDIPDTSIPPTTRQPNTRGRNRRRSRPGNGNDDESTDTSNENSNDRERRRANRNRNHTGRDERGRFTPRERSIFDSLTRLAQRRGMGQAEEVDPLIASAHEIRDVLSPALELAGRAGKIGGKIAGKAGRMSLSMYRRMKRTEPLPRDEERHNRQIEETLGEILKRMIESGGSSLLNDLLGLRSRGGRGGRDRNQRGRDRNRDRDRNRRDRNRGGRGRLGSLLAGAGTAVLGGGKKIVQGAGKAAKALGNSRVLGPLGALIGAGTLASQWGGMNDTQKAESVGSLAGGSAGATAGAAAGTALIPIPVVGTAVGAAVGGWLGSQGGAVLGNTVSPYVRTWTDGLKAYNLPQKMESIWKTGLGPVLGKLKEAAGGMKSWLSRMGDGVSSFFSGDSGSGAPTQAAANASDYAIKNAAYVSLGACAQYVNNAFRAQGLQASGNGVDAAKNLINLNKGKFQEVAYNEGYVPQVGDVMSMPSNSKSKHNYGHVAVYTKDGWVSDYKQGEKYGNTAAPNKDYYEEIKSGKIKPTIARMIPDGTTTASGSNAGSGLSVNEKARREEAMKYFISQGWTKEQAAGIVGNIQKESKYDHQVSGDSGKAYGLAQWHPDRQANFKKAFGKDIRQASYKEQLAFINYELTKGDEKAAGNKLKQAKTAAQAGAIVSEHYEQPKQTEKEKRERAGLAEGILKNTVVQSVTQKAPPSNSALGVDVGGLSRNFMPSSTYQPATQSYGLNLGVSMLKSVFNIPDMPAIKTQLSSGNSNQPIVVQANNEAIGQNVSDRDLAHAITGGIGMSRAWD